MNASELAPDSPSVPTFDALNLSDEVKTALDEIGYVNPTPVQLATYAPAIEGRDIIVQARTGTGKTAAFAIPLVDRLLRNEPFVQALVLAPTRELALQSAKELARIGKHKQLRAAAVYGGAPMGRQIDELAAGAQIVSGTPGRVLDHLRRGTLDPSRIRVLVLDEMDEMLSMGFARELNAILELIPDRTRRQTMCFSATVDDDVRRHAERHMRDPQMVSLSSDAVGAEAITHAVYMVSGSDRIGDLIKILEVEDPESAIVFCNLRSETEQVAGQLKQAGFNADWLNGDLPQRDREIVMSATREGKLRYLVATDVAARGIDISHLTHVINYSFPESAAAYVHRTGRTGRAGRTGSAISLVSPIELGRLYYLRLEYKISPVERSLPSRGELNTRREADRVALLSEAFGSAVPPSDLALARRLLTHPEAERMVGGLLGAFFGTQGENVDDQAAAARRARGPTPTAPRERERERERERDVDRGGDRGRDRDRGADRGRDGDRDRDRDRVRTRDRDRDRNGDRDRSRNGDRDRSRSGDRDRDAGSREGRDRAPSPFPSRSPSELAATSELSDAAEPARDETGEREAEGRPASDTAALLYLDIGRKDGVRIGEIAKLVREAGDLRRAEVGRIRIRDRYTLIEVPEEKLDFVVEKLRGRSVGERALSPERAKGDRE